ncbi:hypothetical protein PSI23_12650 [Xenorhabdus sp. XENO-10]|uniref:Uncharacterized protein n=1 Tax=Xenorhabdus yunnanensis TaxID=3025878 RepID=A0ABT5LG91_9GAMM|nr:hypothetical protein [Xenorhabdus yunnanensis]MDC9590125.1 hypothetical protein [Xenorhabdus yunnanensis]
MVAFSQLADFIGLFLKSYATKLQGFNDPQFTARTDGICSDIYTFVSQWSRGIGFSVRPDIIVITINPAANQPVIIKGPFVRFDSKAPIISPCRYLTKQGEMIGALR